MNPGEEQFKYWIQLVGLDEDFATFHNEQNHVTMTIPTDHWVKMHRPGAIHVSPEVAPG